MILIDTGILAAFINSKDINHNQAKTILNNIRQKKYGTAIITDYILNEVVTLIYVRIKRADLSLKIGNIIIQEKLGKFVKIPTEIIQNIWTSYQNHVKIGLSFTDCSLVEMGKFLNCKDIATFDKGFNGLMKVISTI